MEAGIVKRKYLSFFFYYCYLVVSWLLVPNSTMKHIQLWKCFNNALIQIADPSVHWHCSLIYESQVRDCLQPQTKPKWNSVHWPTIVWILFSLLLVLGRFHVCDCFTFPYSLLCGTIHVGNLERMKKEYLLEFYISTNILTQLPLSWHSSVKPLCSSWLVSYPVHCW